MQIEQVEVLCQGRRLSREQLSWLRQWIAHHRRWSRTRLSRELCRHWGWRNGRGELKNFAARSFLEKLAARSLVVLPDLRIQNRPPRPNPDQLPGIDWPTPSVCGRLADLEPLQWILPAPGTQEAKHFDRYLAHCHYLGLRIVGENMKYLVRDQAGRDLACLLFGAPAWQATARDQFLGWDPSQRVAGLPYLTNNTRFLILPWVRVSGLAAYLLSRVSERVSPDWQRKYGHPIYLLETFVEQDRFTGTCYRAANWLYVGQTQGRGRQGLRLPTPTEPIKDVFLYPLVGRLCQRLLAVGPRSNAVGLNSSKPAT
jgi:Druantia protein DruA